MSDTKNPGWGAFGPGEALQVLWMKSHRDMTTGELQWFAEGAASFVSEFSKQLEDVLIDTASLVASDGSRKGQMRAGSFESPSDVSNLLYSVAHQISLLNGMAEIGSEASGLLIDQLEKGAQA